MTFQEGNANGAGRPKGSKNKLNIDIKNVFDSVFVKMGGEEALLEWAKGHKGRYYEIWAKMNPKKLQGEMTHTHESFIHMLAEEEKKKQQKLKFGQPLKMIECSADEVSKEENNAT